MVIAKTKELEVQVKRARYADGYASKKFKLGGVKRLFYIGLLPYTQESRHNVRLLLQAVNLRKLQLPLTLSPDMKIGLYLIMKQDGGCKHNCIYCTGCSPWLEEGVLLTIGMLREFNRRYNEALARGEVPRPQDYQNAINELLLDWYPDDTLIIDIINFPSLHVLLGIVDKVNYLFINFI